MLLDVKHLVIFHVFCLNYELNIPDELRVQICQDLNLDQTSIESYGIKIKRDNKWIILIQNAKRIQCQEESHL